MSGLPFSCFETDGFKENQKFDAFRESINVIFDVHNPIVQKKDFYAKIKTYLIDEMLLVNVLATGQEFIRSNAMIAKDSIDHFLIQIFHEGNTNPLKFSHSNTCDSGKILVLDASKPRKAFNSSFNNLTLVLPRRLIGKKLMNGHEQHGRVIDTASNPFAEILYKYLISLEGSVENVLVKDAHSLIAPSTDLVAAALNFNYSTNSQGRETIRVHCETAQKFRIKEFLDKNISNPELKVELIEKEFNMSRSNLYRLFSDHGGVVNYLRRRRMEIAYKQLISSQSTNTSIAQVGYQVGFLSESSFSRSFKNCFGLNPREARNEGAQGFLKREGFKADSGRMWENWFYNL